MVRYIGKEKLRKSISKLSVCFMSDIVKRILKQRFYVMDIFLLKSME